jgi:pYEATS domain-containing protein involved in immunity
MDGAGPQGSIGGIVDTTLDVALKALRTPVQTQRAIYAVLGLCGIGILVMIAFAIDLGPDRGLSFIAWAVLTALASTFAGGIFGLLFGLPTARKTDGRGATSGTGVPVGGGYEESTSLEQIADWLTKIIVGLTLTQFASWSAAFDRLSLKVTHDLLCPAAPGPCGYVPGASLVSAYVLGGFIIAYMWTRRFFIIEMVARDDSVRRMIQAQEQQEQAEKDGRVQGGDEGPTSLSPPADSSRTDAILAEGRRQASGKAKDVANALQAGDDSEDPWRGAFGGSASSNDAVLSATVSAIPGQTASFKIDVSIAGATPDRQRELAGQNALFYLHPSFGKAVRSVSFGPDGRASLVLYAYGAFTIGALLEDGTKLELNLAILPGAPDQFRNS